MARCVHCRKETSKYTLIEGMGRIAVCEECMKTNDVSVELLKKLRGESSEEDRGEDSEEESEEE